MQFFYLDPQAQIHGVQIPHAIHRPIIDIDVHWLHIGHKTFKKRLHGMDCFEKIAAEIPDDHQFTFRQWYTRHSQTTECVWYSVPKHVLAQLPNMGAQAKSVVFELQKFFPPALRNKSVVCFLEVPHCELAAGFVQGHCVCFKKLPAEAPIQVQHEWSYFQQAYPQWTFDHSVYLTYRSVGENTLIQTHAQTIHISGSDDIISNRVKLYGLD